MRRLIIAALALGVLVAPSVATAHHVDSRPGDARLAKLYPQLVKPGFTWQRLHHEWYRTHPAAVKVHVLPYEQQFSCIAMHEAGDKRNIGSTNWHINTGNGYYGGLQMDRTFQRTYGPELYTRKGTANYWTREEQIRVAGRAVKTRGFTPWPNTARYCGLLAPRVKTTPNARARIDQPPRLDFVPYIVRRKPVPIQVTADLTVTWLKALGHDVEYRTVHQGTLTPNVAGEYRGTPDIYLHPGVALSLYRRDSSLQNGHVLIHELGHSNRDRCSTRLLSEGPVDAWTLDLVDDWGLMFLGRDTLPTVPVYKTEVRTVRLASMKATGSTKFNTPEAVAWRIKLRESNCATRASMMEVTL